MSPDEDGIPLYIAGGMQEIPVLGAEPDVELPLDVLTGIGTVDDAVGQASFLPCPREAVDAKASPDGAGVGPCGIRMA